MPPRAKAAPDVEQIDPAAQDAVRALVHAVHKREPVDFRGGEIPQWVQDIIDEELAGSKDLAVLGQEPPLCEACFPDGWAGLPDGAYAPGCQHGSWHHPGRIPGVKVLDGEVVAEPAAVEADAEGGIDLGEDVSTVTF